MDAFSSFKQGEWDVGDVQQVKWEILPGWRWSFCFLCLIRVISEN